MKTNNTQLLYNVKEAAQMLSLGKTTLYSLMSEHKIKYLKIGHSTRFTMKQLDEFIQTESKKAQKKYDHVNN